MAQVITDYIDFTKQTILVGDSCHCGLAVLDSVFQWAGDKNIIFLADYKYNPFGQKTSLFVKSLVESWIMHFSKFYNLSDLVIACNTASIAFVKEGGCTQGKSVRSMLEAVKNFCLGTKDLSGKTIGILGTALTIQSEVYQKTIQQTTKAKTIAIAGTACERLVSQLALKDYELNKAVDAELKAIADSNPDYILLACTCFGRLAIRLSQLYTGQIVDLNEYLISNINLKIPHSGKILLLTTDPAKKQLVDKAFRDLFDRSAPVMDYDWDRGCALS